MILEIITRIGEPPVVIHAGQVIIRQDNGTPIGVCAHYGPDNSYAMYHCKDPEFNKTLRDLGVDMTVIVDTLRLPKPPPGAVLIGDPRKKA